MKKICMVVLIASALFAGVTPEEAEADPGWWVVNDWFEDGVYTNIQDDFDALSARVDARDLRLSDLEETQYVFGLNEGLRFPKNELERLRELLRQPLETGPDRS